MGKPPSPAPVVRVSTASQSKPTYVVGSRHVALKPVGCGAKRKAASFQPHRSDLPQRQSQELHSDRRNSRADDGAGQNGLHFNFIKVVKR